MLQSEADNTVAASQLSEVKVRVTREAENKDANDDQAANATGGNILKPLLMLNWG